MQYDNSNSGWTHIGTVETVGQNMKYGLEELTEHRDGEGDAIYSVNSWGIPHLRPPCQAQWGEEHVGKGIQCQL